VSTLAAITYDAVLSAVTVPPWRPEPKPPTFEDLPFSKIFLKDQPNAADLALLALGFGREGDGRSHVREHGERTARARLPIRRGLLR
jgi:hypothetical protein